MGIQAGSSASSGKIKIKIQLVLKSTDVTKKERGNEESPVTLADDGLLGGFRCYENVQLLQHVLQVVFHWLRLSGGNRHLTPSFNTKVFE